MYGEMNLSFCFLIDYVLVCSQLVTPFSGIHFRIIAVHDYVLCKNLVILVVDLESCYGFKF
jgi:hypothetical protein